MEPLNHFLMVSHCIYKTDFYYFNHDKIHASQVLYHTKGKGEERNIQLPQLIIFTMGNETKLQKPLVKVIHLFNYIVILSLI